MSTIQLSELQPVQTELKELSNQQCSDIVGGRRGRGNRGIRNNITTNISNDIVTISPVQINVAIANTVVLVFNAPKTEIDISTIQKQKNGFDL